MAITFYYTPKGSESLEIELKLYDKPKRSKFILESIIPAVVLIHSLIKYNLFQLA